MRAYSIFDDYPKKAIEILNSSGISVNVHPTGCPRPNANQMQNILKEYDCVIVGTTQKMGESMFDTIQSPKIIATASVGTDHIKIPPSKKSLITVLNTPSANTTSAAEYIVGMMLMTRHRLLEGSELYAQAKDNKQLSRKPEELFGKTIGFVGAGRISTKVMSLLQPFGVKCICNTDDEEQRKYLVDDYGVKFVTLDTLAMEADIISVNVPNIETTKNLINEEIISLMKKDATFICISREEVVDTLSLIEKANNYPSFTVALDFDLIPEYVEKCNRTNIFITPHIAGGTIEARIRMFVETAENIVRESKIRRTI